MYKRTLLLPFGLSLAIGGGLGGCAATHKPRAQEPVAREAAPAFIAPVAPVAIMAAPAPVVDKEARTSTGTIPRTALTHMLDEAPGRFLQHVEIVPRFRSGRFHGWRLVSFFPGDPRFSAVDLQSGDVVTAVNGQPIEQPDQLMKVWESLRQDSALTVNVERDGRPRQLHYDIRD